MLKAAHGRINEHLEKIKKNVSAIRDKLGNPSDPEITRLVNESVEEKEHLVKLLQTLEKQPHLTDRVRALYHEVYGPTNNVKMQLQLVRDLGGGGLHRNVGELHQLLNYVERNCERIRNVSSYLTTTSELKRVDLNSYIAEVAARFDEDKPEGVTIRIEPGDGAVPAEIDAGKMEVALHNLVRNAWEHGSKEITMKASKGRLGSFISVSNTGTFVPEAERDGIFEGFSTKPAREGLQRGIGLRTVRMIAEEHGGGVRVRSSRENGGTTTFTIKLPDIEGELVELERIKRAALEPR